MCKLKTFFCKHVFLIAKLSQYLWMAILSWEYILEVSLSCFICNLCACVWYFFSASFIMSPVNFLKLIRIHYLHDPSILRDRCSVRNFLIYDSMWKYCWMHAFMNECDMYVWIFLKPLYFNGKLSSEIYVHSVEGCFYNQQWKFQKMSSIQLRDFQSWVQSWLDFLVSNYHWYGSSTCLH